jgi:hypothetical protein
MDSDWFTIVYEGDFFTATRGDVRDGGDGSVHTLLGAHAVRQADQATPAR